MRLLEKTEVRKPETEAPPPSPNGHPEVEAVLPGEAAVARAARRSLDGHARGFSRLWPFLGPAFIAAVAYIDPGNFATNIAAGAQFGYLLLWVVVARQPDRDADPDAVGEARDRDRKEPARALPRDLLPADLDRPLGAGRGRSRWSTDIAEVVGAALGLNLLFGIPLFPAALIAGAGAFAILALQQRGFRRLEAAIAVLAGVVLVAFGFEIFWAKPDARRCRRAPVRARLRRHREHPAGHRDHRRDRDAARRLPALGADPAAGGRARNDEEKRKILRFEKIDVVIAMAIAGVVNLSMMIMAAALFHVGGLTGIDSIEGAFEGLQTTVSDNAATVFGIALLASGFASSSVGTMSGSGRDAGIHPAPDPDLPPPSDHPGAGADRARDRGRPHRRPGDQPGGALVRDPVRADPAARHRAQAAR